MLRHVGEKVGDSRVCVVVGSESRRHPAKELDDLLTDVEESDLLLVSGLDDAVEQRFVMCCSVAEALEVRGAAVDVLSRRATYPSTRCSGSRCESEPEGRAPEVGFVVDGFSKG